MIKNFNKEDIKIDFLNDTKHYERKNHNGKNELIARAMGLGKGVDHVFDLTCGLAEDAVFLTQLGFKVTAVERNKIIFEILSRALLIAHENKKLAALQIIHQDSIVFLESEYFKKLEKQNCAIYLDPMFPEKKKSALPRKEMQAFRNIVGDDLDSVQLLQKALVSGVSRVVVKRPIKSPALIEKPTHSFKGKTVRYDFYQA